MSRISFTSQPFLLGFEELDRLVERTLKAGSDNYPPFNIEQRGADIWRISLAVAGFGEADLAITVEERELVVGGRQAGEDDSRVFLHRGIAARPFERRFVLEEHVEVEGAALENGLLHIDLVRRKPESTVRNIRIEPVRQEE